MVGRRHFALGILARRRHVLPNKSHDCQKQKSGFKCIARRGHTGFVYTRSNTALLRLCMVYIRKLFSIVNKHPVGG